MFVVISWGMAFKNELQASNNLFIYIRLPFSDAAKTVYVYTDLLGSSKYTLYKNNYKYEETSYKGNFCVWGFMRLKRQYPIFMQRQGKIPYHYYGGSVLSKENHSYDNNFYVHVSSQLFGNPSSMPVFFSLTVWVRFQTNTYTDLDGYANIPVNLKNKVP